LLGRDGAYAIVRLRSGEMRKIACGLPRHLGEVVNQRTFLRQLGKAGAALARCPSDRSRYGDEPR
jgi:large subunit ribosomal protein L2